MKTFFLFSFSFSFNDRDSTTFFDTFHYCVLCPYVKRFSDIRRSWLRIVTDVIIFCIHGISLLNKIKDQNLEFEKQLSTSSITEYFFFFFLFFIFFIFSPLHCYTYIFYSTKAQPWKSSWHYTFNVSGAATSEMWRGRGWGEKKKKQLKFNVYVTRLCSSLQHLESCLEERDKALCCPPLWTCNGFSPLYDSSPLLFMYHKHVPVYTEAPLCTPFFVWKRRLGPGLDFVPLRKWFWHKRHY